MGTSRYQHHLATLALQMQDAPFRDDAEREAFHEGVTRLIRGFDPDRPAWLEPDERALFEQLQQTADAGAAVAWNVDLTRDAIPSRDDDYVADFIDQMVDENAEMVDVVRGLSPYDQDRIVSVLTQRTVAVALREWNEGGRDFFPGVVRGALANMPQLEVRNRVMEIVFDEAPSDVESPGMGG